MNFSKEKVKDSRQKIKTSSKKRKSKVGRKTSSKRQKKYTKQAKYASPSKLATTNFSSRVKRNLELFKNNYFTKSVFEKPSANEIKNIRNKKSLSRKKKQRIPGLKQVVAGQNIKMKTIDLADSNIIEDLSGSSSSSHVYNPMLNEFILKKSATVTSFGAQNKPVKKKSSTRPKNQRSSQNRTDTLNFYH